MFAKPQDCWKEIESSKGQYEVYNFRAVKDGEEITGWEVYRRNETEQADARAIANAFHQQAMAQNTPDCPYDQRIG